MSLLGVGIRRKFAVFVLLVTISGVLLFDYFNCLVVCFVLVWDIVELGLFG